MNKITGKSKIALLSGKIICTLCTLFLLFDAIMKIIKFAAYTEGTKQLGLPEESVQALGIFLLLSTILYIVPRTAIVGALLLTAYLGGATAITFSAHPEGGQYFFPILFAAAVWIGEYLRNERLRMFIPYLK